MVVAGRVGRARTRDQIVGTGLRSSSRKSRFGWPRPIHHPFRSHTPTSHVGGPADHSSLTPATRSVFAPTAASTPSTTAPTKRSSRG
jgi:hypothetical protein